MAETLHQEKLLVGPQSNGLSSYTDQKDFGRGGCESKIPAFEVDAILLKSLIREQTGFEMKECVTSKDAEDGSTHLYHSISRTPINFVSALEQQLDKLWVFTRDHVKDVKTRSKVASIEPGDIVRLGESLLGLQSVMIKSLKELRDLAEDYDDVNSFNEASDFMNRNDVRDTKYEVEDLIETELSNLLSLVGEKHSQPSVVELMRRGVVSGQARRHSYGYQLIAPAVLNVAMWIILLFTSQYGGAPNWNLMIRFFRGQLILVTYAHLLAINKFGWAKARINYLHPYILPMGPVTPAHVFHSAGILTILFGVLMFLFMILSVFVQDSNLIFYFALAMWLLLVTFMFNPLDILNRGARIFFLKQTGQVFLSPLFPALFSQSWLTNQMTSMIVVGLDLQYQFCYFAISTWAPGTSFDTCSTSRIAVRPIITALPSLWRFLQSLRRYVETGKQRYIVDLFTYVLTFAVILASVAIELTQPVALGIGLLFTQLSVWIVVWAVVATANILWNYAGDLFISWNILGFDSRRRVLRVRRHRLFDCVALYYLAMVVNLFLRVAGTLKTTFAVMRHTSHGDIIFTMLALGELFRRFMWNFFRVEVQWLGLKS